MMREKISTEDWVENRLPFWLMSLLKEEEIPSNEHMRKLAKRALEVTESEEAFAKIFPKDRSPEEFSESWEMAKSRREEAKEILANEPVLDPEQISGYIHQKLVRMLSVNPDGISEVFERMVKRFPILTYIYHMELSGHSYGFCELMKDLKEQGVEIEMPFADVGCGPGHMMWRFLKDGFIPPGDITMVDLNPDYIVYAKNMLVEREEADKSNRNNFHFLNINAEELAKEADKMGTKFNTVYSSLVLQWLGEKDGKELPPEEAAQILKSVCQSIFDSLNPGGKFILIGEIPPNITATTPFSFLQSGGEDLLNFDIGYNKGVPLDQVNQTCIEVGFQVENEAKFLMGMTHDEGEIEKAKKRLNKLFPEADRKREEKGKLEFEDVEELLENYYLIKNVHYALAIVYRKPED